MRGVSGWPRSAAAQRLSRNQDRRLMIPASVLQVCNKQASGFVMKKRQGVREVQKGRNYLNCTIFYTSSSNKHTRNFISHINYIGLKKLKYVHSPICGILHVQALCHGQLRSCGGAAVPPPAGPTLLKVWTRRCPPVGPSGSCPPASQLHWGPVCPAHGVSLLQVWACQRGNHLTKSPRFQ